MRLIGGFLIFLVIKKEMKPTLQLPRGSKISVNISFFEKKPQMQSVFATSFLWILKNSQNIEDISSKM